jgi:cytochrome c oxidase cbb3-type subunit 1
MSSSTQELSSAQTGCPPEEVVSVEQIDVSCRWPVLVFFGGAAFWFLVSGIFGLLVSIKLHSSTFLASCPWLTYGRIRPAQLDALVYGFAAPAAFGVTLWLFCRLGRTRLVAPVCLLLAAKIWNIGVLIGIAGILAGDGTGFEWLEFPRYAAPVLFVAYLMTGLWAVLTFRARRQQPLFPTQWYLLAALFWFAWIYSAANLLLVFAPVRGVVQLCVSAWYAGNLLNVWLSTIGVGVIFYFIPKLTNRPLHSYYLALAAFWGIALFGGWGGLNVTSPLPSWIPALSNVAAIMMILPVACVALNVCGTLAGNFASAKADPIPGFIRFGAFSFLLAQTMNILVAIRPLNEILYFTYFTTAQIQIALLGFFASVMFGAIYYIAPRLLGVEAACPRAMRSHLYLLIFGVLISGFAMAIGGIAQGIKLHNAETSFPKVIQTTLPFLHFSTVGSLLIVLAGLNFIYNLLALAVRCCRACCEAKSKAEVRP